MGCGKTTLAIELGKRIVSELGKVVAIVTNDQGEMIVDTNLVRDYGFAVTEVVGGCFCCKLPDFITHARQMISEVNPDILIAEAVGSCTDFQATVYAPIRKYYGEQFELAPFVVLVDATTVLDHFDKEHNIASPIGALYSWQVKDGDILAINKVDIATKESLPKIEAFLRKMNGDAEIIQISAKTGYNLDKLLKTITEGFHRRRPTITKDVNYDVYAKAEAELGWFNGMYTINSNLPMNVVAVMEGLLKEINRRVRECKGEIAHAKTRFSTRNGWVKASLVISDESIGITGEVPPPSKDIDVILNIRASIDPVALKSIVKGSLEIVTANYSARYKEWSSSSFRPGYPKPYYRLVHT